MCYFVQIFNFNNSEEISKKLRAYSIIDNSSLLIYIKLK